LSKHLSLERGEEVTLDDVAEIVMKARKGDEEAVTVSQRHFNALSTPINAD